MFDGNKILIGLIAFIAIATTPLWYSAAVGNKGPRPALELPVDAAHGKCVESKAYMQAFHMDLLDQWRDAVVRDGQRVYISRADQTKHEMSLQRSCLRCHTSKVKFCDRCHDYAGVDVYCWDCHVEPKEQDGK